MHPCPSWEGVGFYRDRIRKNLPIKPIVLCEQCYVVLDGWHRLAAHWLEGRTLIRVVFTNKHWMDGKERCAVDLTNWIETLKPYKEMDCISGSYHKKDWDNPYFLEARNRLMDAGDVSPLMRLWEHTRSLVFLGQVRNKKILDIGTRESVVPQFLAAQGAIVTALDLVPESITQRVGVEVVYGDATELPFPDLHFDIVLCSATIKHIENDSLAMKEMARVTNNILAVSFDFGPEYMEIGNEFSGRRVYDRNSLFKRLVAPIPLKPLQPDFERSDWTDYPIESQAPAVYEKLKAAGLNIQVGVLLFKREKRGRPRK